MRSPKVNSRAVATHASSLVLLVLIAGLIAGPPRAAAQDTARVSSAPRREGLAVVGIFSGDVQRIGILIPIGKRWMRRPDMQGYAQDYEGLEKRWWANPGISLVARSVPTEEGWIYAAFRSALSIDGFVGGYDSWVNAFTFSVGGHATLNPVLSVFGEAGIAVTYEEYDSDTKIDRSLAPLLRFGFTLRRRPRP